MKLELMSLFNGGDPGFSSYALNSRMLSAGWESSNSAFLAGTLKRPTHQGASTTRGRSVKRSAHCHHHTTPQTSPHLQEHSRQQIIAQFRGVTRPQPLTLLCCRRRLTQAASFPTFLKFPSKTFLKIPDKLLEFES